MNQSRCIMVNIQIRDIANQCAEKLTDSNYDLIEQLFEAKVKKLFSYELPDFQKVNPNFKDLLEWFWRFVNIRDFTKKLGAK